MPDPSQLLRTALLADVPAVVDRFDGHSGVARALRATVTDDGSGMLALVGSFGSGKSTVVRLMQEQCDGADVVVVTFDAWAHRGASLHRAILKTLVDTLTRDAPSLSPDTKKAVGPVQTTTTTTTRPGPWGIWAGVALALVPFLVTFVEPYASSYTASLPDGDVAIASEAKYGQAAFWSFVCIVGWWWIVAWAKSLPPLDKAQEDSERALFTQEVETTQTVHGRELSSDDFEHHVRSLVSAWLAQDDRRRLVLVLDDLDRLEAQDQEEARGRGEALEDARLVLRSLHRLCGGLDPVKHFWTVVPKRPEDAPHPVRDEQLDKLYLARFDVPETLPNPGADYLEAKLHEAFPEHDLDTLRHVARLWIWGARKESERTSFTPRRAIRFINDLVVLYRQHGDAPVPLVAQTAYLTREDPLSVHGVDLRRLEVAIGVGDGEWFPLAAALTYGLAPPLAVEFFLRARVEGAFTHGDAAALRAAFAEHPAATLRLVESIVHVFATGATAHLVDNAAFVLEALPDSPSVRAAWAELLRDVASVTDWVNVTPNGAAGRGLGLLLARLASHDAERLDTLFDAINDSIRPHEQKDGSIQQPDSSWIESWAATTARAFDAALEKAGDRSPFQAYSVPGTPDLYLQALRAVAKHAPDAAMPLFVPTVPRADIAALLDQMALGSADALSASLFALLRVGGPWDVSTLVLTAQAILIRANTPFQGGTSGPTLGAIYECAASLILLAHHPASTVQNEARAALDGIGAQGILSSLANHSHLRAAGSNPPVELDGRLHALIALAVILHEPQSASVLAVANVHPVTVADLALRYHADHALEQASPTHSALVRKRRVASAA